MRKLVTMLLILFIFSLSHAEIATSVENIKISGSSGDILQYKINFVNTGTNSEYISLFADANFLPSNIFTLSGGESKTISIEYKIPLNSKSGEVLIPVKVFDESGKERSFSPIFLQANIIPRPLVYRNSALLELSVVPTSVSPLETFSVILKINNTGKDVASSNVVLESGFFGRSKNVSLKAGINEIVFEGLSLAKDTTPGTYVLTASVYLPEDTLLISTVNYDVKGYSDCKTQFNKEVTIFGKTYEAMVTNVGTEEGKCLVADEITSIEYKLLTSHTEGISYNGSAVSWSVLVKPGQSKVVYYNVTYLPILAIPFIAVGIFLTIWYFTREMDVKKELIDYKIYPGAMLLKFQIKIKNLSSKDYKNIEVIDLLPSFVKDVKDFGTVSGSLTKYSGQLAVIWKIEELKAKHEVILSYSFRTSVEVLGKIVIPTTLVKYINGKGEHREETSSLLVIEVEEKTKK